MSTARSIKKLGVIGDVHSEHHRLKATLATCKIWIQTQSSVLVTLSMALVAQTRASNYSITLQY